MTDVSGDSVRQSQHALTLSLTLNPNPVTLQTSELSPNVANLTTLTLGLMLKASLAIKQRGTIYEVDQRYCPVTLAVQRWQRTERIGDDLLLVYLMSERGWYLTGWTIFC